jgi:hypothetical protein
MVVELIVFFLMNYFDNIPIVAHLMNHKWNIIKEEITEFVFYLTHLALNKEGIFLF